MQYGPCKRAASGWRNCAGSVQRGQAMRSNDTKSSATKSSMPIKPRLRLSLAMMTAIATVFAFVSSADAAQRKVASGGAGGSMANSAGRVDPGGARGAPDGRQIARRTAIGVRPADERYVRDEVLIQLASSVPRETIDALGRRLRLNRAASFTANNITTFRWKICARAPGARCHSLPRGRTHRPGGAAQLLLPIGPRAAERRAAPQWLQAKYVIQLRRV